MLLKSIKVYFRVSIGKYSLFKNYKKLFSFEKLVFFRQVWEFILGVGTKTYLFYGW